MDKCVSVVIPCYNSEKTIGRVVELCEDEFRRMTGTDWEIILVNDCSADNTWHEIEKC